MKKKYMVWFEQINQVMYEVMAEDEGEARLEARHKWIMNNEPIILDVVKKKSLGLKKDET